MKYKSFPPQSKVHNINNDGEVRTYDDGSIVVANLFTLLPRETIHYSRFIVRIWFSYELCDLINHSFTNQRLFSHLQDNLLLKLKPTNYQQHENRLLKKLLKEYRVKEIWPVNTANKFDAFRNMQHLYQIILDLLCSSCLHQRHSKKWNIQPSKT